MKSNAFAVTISVSGAALMAVVHLGAQTPVSVPSPTFNKEVAPILYKNCVNCHPSTGRPITSSSSP
jgi:hypothetical protein